jgi:hypothetical protein
MTKRIATSLRMRLWRETSIASWLLIRKRYTIRFYSRLLIELAEERDVMPGQGCGDDEGENGDEAETDLPSLSSIPSPVAFLSTFCPLGFTEWFWVVEEIEFVDWVDWI